MADMAVSLYRGGEEKAIERFETRVCWPAGKASTEGTTAFENTTLYS